jgi:hypothetical protein
LINFWGKVNEELSIPILMIVFSKRIASLIWIGRYNNDEVIIKNLTNDILPSLISVLGLYFIVKSLAQVMDGLTYLGVMPRYNDKVNLSYHIIQLIYQVMILIIGILLFVLPEKVIRIKDNIKKFL